MRRRGDHITNRLSTRIILGRLQPLGGCAAGSTLGDATLLELLLHLATSRCMRLGRRDQLGISLGDGAALLVGLAVGTRSCSTAISSAVERQFLLLPRVLFLHRRTHPPLRK